MAGVEPATSSLPRMRSTTELHQQHEPLFATTRIYECINKKWAENGAQTRDPQLGRLVLYRLSYFRELTTTSATVIFLWEQMDSNHRRWKPADLQSAPFGRSGILPISISKFNFFLSLLSDSNQRPRDYKSRALANWAKEAVTFRLYSHAFCYVGGKAVQRYNKKCTWPNILRKKCIFLQKKCFLAGNLWSWAAFCDRSFGGMVPKAVR